MGLGADGLPQLPGKSLPEKRTDILPCDILSPMVKPVIVTVADNPEAARSWMFVTTDSLLTHFDVLGAQDFDSLLERLQSQPVKGILMGVTPANGSGYSWIERLREMPQFEDVPILAILDRQVHAAQTTLLRLGADWVHVLQKDQTPGLEIFLLIRKLLKDSEFVQHIRERVSERSMEITMKTDELTR